MPVVGLGTGGAVASGERTVLVESTEAGDAETVRASDLSGLFLGEPMLGGESCQRCTTGVVEPTLAVLDHESLRDRVAVVADVNPQDATVGVAVHAVLGIGTLAGQTVDVWPLLLAQASPTPVLGHERGGELLITLGQVLDDGGERLDGLDLSGDGRRDLNR